MLPWPNNGGMADGMARNSLMAGGMAVWSNGRIDGNGLMAGMVMAGMVEWQNGEWLSCEFRAEFCGIPENFRFQTLF